LMHAQAPWCVQASSVEANPAFLDVGQYILRART